MAIKVSGPWNEGYVMDMYVEKSIYIQDDAFGSPIFNTTYTEIGKLLHSMKYNGHYDNSRAIADICTPFLEKWLADKEIDIIIPAPPTVRRDNQPVYMIAEAIANSMNSPYSDCILEKTGQIQSKSMPKDKKEISGTIIQLKPAKRKCNILLIDDFYSTGETAAECVNVLKKDILIDKVFYFSISKTK